METKSAQHERRMATMQRVLSKLRHELEQKKVHAPRGAGAGHPAHRTPLKRRRPGHRLDA